MENSRYPNRLKKYRLLFCLSQKEVATVLGLKDASPLSRWEKGITLPNIIQLFTLCSIYKAMPADLYLNLWQHISNEISAKGNDLLTHKESFTNHEAYQL